MYLMLSTIACKYNIHTTMVIRNVCSGKNVTYLQSYEFFTILTFIFLNYFLFK